MVEHSQSDKFGSAEVGSFAVALDLGVLVAKCQLLTSAFDHTARGFDADSCLD